MKKLQLAYGGVVVDESDRILLCKPRNEHDGYAWTFPKGRPEPGEHPMQTAIREVLEETGYDSFAGRRLPGRYIGGTSVTEYYLMTPFGDPQAFGSETETIQWVTLEAAEILINQTRNSKGKARDLNVLRDASALIQEINQSRSVSRIQLPRGVDVCCMVNGRLSNAEICEQMLEDEKESPEVSAYMIKLAIEMGFSEEEALRYWG